MSKTDVDNGDLTAIPVRKVQLPGVSEDIQVMTSGFALPDYDYIAATYPTATTEVYTYKTGGSGGTTVGIITITYSDSTKSTLTSAVKT